MNKYKYVNKFGLSLTDYEGGGWGSLGSSVLKAPVSYARNFVKSDGTVDIEALFKELCEVVSLYVTGVAPILRRVAFSGFPEDVKDGVVKSIYHGVRFLIANNDLEEIVKTTTFSTPSFNRTQDSSNKMFLNQTIGRNAFDCLVDSGILEYEIVESNVMYRKLANGNVEIVGKVDPSKVTTWI